MAHAQPLVVQVDMDPLSSYVASYYGEPESGGLAQEPVYTRALPRVLELLRSLGLRATLFVVGREVSAAQTVLRSALAEGHEIANHTQNHQLGLSRQPIAGIRREIADAHHAIRTALQTEPRGFRAPGWDVGSQMLEVLVEFGYLYDASVVPSWTVLAQNATLQLLSWFRAPAGFGSWKVCLAHPGPYFPDAVKFWATGSQRRLVEIPAGVLPWSRIPRCVTFQLTLGGRWLAANFQHVSPTLPVVYVAHGIDFLDRCEIPPSLQRHPGGGKTLQEKMTIVRRTLVALSQHRRSLTTLELARTQFAPTGTQVDLTGG